MKSWATIQYSSLITLAIFTKIQQTPDTSHMNYVMSFMSSKFHICSSLRRQQTLLTPRWPNVDPVGSTLGQLGPNMPCYLGCHCITVFNITLCWTMLWWQQTMLLLALVKVLNPLRAKFLRGNTKHIFTFYVIPPHGYDTGGWNPSSNKTRTYPLVSWRHKEPGHQQQWNWLS